MDKPDNLAATEFFKFNIRAGTILSVEPVPKSKKLLKLEVSFGSSGTRTILSGLAPRRDPVAATAPGNYVMEGQRVVAVINLEPRTMMGLESCGMLLAAADESGQIHLVHPGPVPDGAEVG